MKDDTFELVENLVVGQELKTCTIESIEKVLKPLNAVYVETENGFLDIHSNNKIYPIKGVY